MSLKEEVKQHLEEKIIPFWKGLRDDDFGGYYGYMDFNLQVQKEYEKGCILNSRILWFFSNAYTALGDTTLLEEANHAFCYMKNVFLDKTYGGVFWSVTYDGKVADSTKHTYNQAFAIYALASYYEASKDKSALDFAYQLFERLETTCVDQYGYLESFTQDWKPESNEKLSENGLLADKTMNTHLHILEAYTQLYRVGKENKVKKRLTEILKIFKDRIYNQEKVRLEVFFDEKFHTISELYSFGHDIEASWLLDYACDVIQEKNIEKETKAYTTALAHALYKNALNSDGSMKNEKFKGIEDQTRIWWVQAEAMVGFYNVYEKTFDEKYLVAVHKLWEYVKENVVDKRQGAEWFWALDKEGEVIKALPIVEPWKCPYHNGRMCIEIMRRIL